MRALLFSIALAACGDKTGQPIDQIDSPQGIDAPVPPGAVPLVVATDHGLLVWNDSAALTTNVAPDITITSNLAPGATAVAVTGDRLYVGRHAPGNVGAAAILAFDHAHALTASATPTATITRPYDATTLRVDGADDLWVEENQFGGQVLRFAGASSLGDAATPAATFHHPNDQLPSFAVEETSKRLFAGQISGSGVVAWNDAMTRTGMPADDFTLSGGAYWGMRIDHDRLYAVGSQPVVPPGGASSVAIWPNASTLSGPASPIVLSMGYTGGFIANLALRDDILVVSARDQNRIMIYTHASAMTADRAPDFTIDDSHMNGPGRLAIDHSHRLYVADAAGVLVFATIDTAPTFVTKLVVPASVGGSPPVPADLALAE
jgi:hypothetical protein